ncbi:TolC family protein [Luteibacter sp. 22Crub2.1]|uniref:TolC family protein n=1 Tax=Luteibacter sp. 22Crub2.1 TaxID=1283288 RepID=UPI0009A72218|nr:TolC family protein [Luteibacter sp. 22Crub2.1]SKB74030.1 Outer membrane protein [Luteibacter sp. 22Crub2.1]
MKARDAVDFNAAQRDEMDAQTKAAATEPWIASADGLVHPWLREDACIPDLLGDDEDAWVSQIDDHCPALRAAAAAIGAADTEIAKQRAGQQPTLDIVATYGNNDQDVGTFPGQSGYRIRTLTLGLQLNIPLYSSGTQSAKVLVDAPLVRADRQFACGRSCAATLSL